MIVKTIKKCYVAIGIFIKHLTVRVYLVIVIYTIRIKLMYSLRYITIYRVITVFEIAVKLKYLLSVCYEYNI